MIGGSSIRLSLLFLLLSHFSLGYRIFLIGDSIDRHVTEEWCDLRGDGPACGGPHCTFWASQSDFRNFPGVTNPVTRCSIDNDSITYLHNYGSKPRGPYHCLPNDQAEKYGNTPMRITRGLDLYFEKFGAPDFISYHSSQWDIIYLFEENGTRKSALHGEYDILGSALWNSSITSFERNLNDRVTELDAHLKKLLRKYSYPSNRTIIALRTAVWSAYPGPFLHAMNTVVRRTAKIRNLTLYDFDKDAWGTVNWDRSRSTEQNEIMRDAIHPKLHHSNIAGEKLLGYFYSANLILRGNISQSRPLLWFGKGVKPNSLMQFKLVTSDELPLWPSEYDMIENVTSFFDKNIQIFASRSSDADSSTASSLINTTLEYNPHILNPSVIKPAVVFYVYERNGQLLRSGPIDALLRRHLRLSPGDIMRVSRSKLDMIPLGPPPPLQLFQHIAESPTSSWLAVNSSTGELNLVEHGRLHAIPNRDALIGLGFTTSNDSVNSTPNTTVLQNVEGVWLAGLPKGPPVPDIYRNGSLFRFAGAREIFVHTDGQKRPISNMGVFSRYGWDLDQVVTVSSINDFNRMPVGPPIL